MITIKFYLILIQIKVSALKFWKDYLGQQLREEFEHLPMIADYAYEPKKSVEEAVTVWFL